MERRVTEGADDPLVVGMGERRPREQRGVGVPHGVVDGGADDGLLAMAVVVLVTEVEPYRNGAEQCAGLRVLAPSRP